MSRKVVRWDHVTSSQGLTKTMLPSSPISLRTRAFLSTKASAGTLGIQFAFHNYSNVRGIVDSGMITGDAAPNAVFPSR